MLELGLPTLTDLLNNKSDQCNMQQSTFWIVAQIEDKKYEFKLF